MSQDTSSPEAIRDNGVEFIHFLSAGNSTKANSDVDTLRCKVNSAIRNSMD